MLHLRERFRMQCVQNIYLYAWQGWVASGKGAEMGLGLLKEDKDLFCRGDPAG